MADKSVLIIGAGVAGLCAGAYAQMNGYRSRIFEMHTMPGGLCAAWKRQGYTIDACIHWLVGSAPRNSWYALWEEMGIVQGREFLYLDEGQRIETSDDKVIVCHRDLNRFEQHLLEIAPEDASLIREFIADTRRLVGFDLGMDNAMEIMGPLDKAKMIARMAPYMGVLNKWTKVSAGEFASRFKSQALQEAFEHLWHREFTMMFLMFTLAWMHEGIAGYPIGGSLPLARAMENRYLDVGGRVRYGARVNRILVEGDQAVGIRLESGEEIRGDIVISAADGHATIFAMLDGRFVDDKVREMYEGWKPFPALVFIGLGVNRSFEGEPRITSGYNVPFVWPGEKGAVDGGRLAFAIRNFDPTLAPPGKTVITATVTGDYGYWKALHQDRVRYEARKREVADAVIAVLDRRYPGLAGQVEMVDVATPVTWERFTGNWQASYEGWLPEPANAMTQVSKTLPGLSGFYMVGQWVAPGGGLPGGLKTGRDVVQILCKNDGKRFTTSKA